MNQPSSTGEIEDTNRAKSELDATQDHISSLISAESDTIITDLRPIGLDGILTLLFLTKNQDKFCSIKTIQSDLGISSPTVYRNINNLEEFGLINYHSLLEEPGKKYYLVS